jgi:O-antigen ligase
VLVGSIHHGESQQAIEDVLPYLLFVCGLVAGRGIGSPRLVLQVGLWVCVIDSIVSMALIESWGPGMRSTFAYFKITAGLPLVGIYLARALRQTPFDRTRARRGFVMHAGILVVLVAGIVLSVSRGMMIGFLLAIAVSAYVRKPSQALLGLTVVLLALAGYSSAFAEFGTEWFRFGQEGTITGRFREVEAAWEGFVSAPMFGQGLGAFVEVDGFKKAFVHNMAAYHLWKFGLVGCGLLSLPLFAIVRELRPCPRRIRALAIGTMVGLIAYLVTCAAYKTYYLVWIHGVVMGTSLTYFLDLSRRLADANQQKTLEHEAALEGSQRGGRGSNP